MDENSFSEKSTDFVDTIILQAEREREVGGWGVRRKTKAEHEWQVVRRRTGGV